MKKILMIITSGLGRGGISIAQFDYIKEIKNISKDFEFHIISCIDNSNQMVGDFKNIGCIVYSLPDRKKKLLSYINSLKKLLKNNKFDVIHVHGNSNSMGIELYLAKKYDIKVRIAHSRNTSTNHGIFNFLLKKIFFKNYTEALAVGEESGKWLFKKEKFTILHNGKEYEKYKFSEEIRNNIRDKYNINEKIALCNVGNCNDQKNQKYLIEIFNKVNSKNDNFVLFIVGDGPNKNCLKEQCKNLNILDKVIFTGRINNVNDFINGMDLMLLPSLYEGLPNVVLEWQINGLNSIVSNTITKECSFTNQVSFLPIGPNDITLWSDKIIDFSFNIEERKKNSYVSRQKLIESGFDIHVNSKNLVKLYNEEINKENKK